MLDKASGTEIGIGGGGTIERRGSTKLNREVDGEVTEVKISRKSSTEK